MDCKYPRRYKSCSLLLLDKLCRHWDHGCQWGTGLGAHGPLVAATGAAVSRSESPNLVAGAARCLDAAYAEAGTGEDGSRI